MTREVALIVDIIDQAYDKPSWHGTNLRGSIRRVSAKDASWRPASGRHNIREIVVHAAYWKYAAARRFTKEGRGSFPLKGSDWFRRPTDSRDATEESWRADVKLLDEMHERLRQAVRRLSARKVASTPPGTKVSNRKILTGIAAHDLYHAGQIQLLKRLINQTRLRLRA